MYLVSALGFPWSSSSGFLFAITPATRGSWLIIAGNEESCQEESAKNEEPMVNVINALISIFGAIGRCALWKYSYHN